jgi:hypothetical protein
MEIMIGFSADVMGQRRMQSNHGNVQPSLIAQRSIRSLIAKPFVPHGNKASHLYDELRECVSASCCESWKKKTGRSQNLLDERARVVPVNSSGVRNPSQLLFSCSILRFAR